MVLDASAVVAILLQEPEAKSLSNKIESDPIRYISAINWLETQLVLNGRHGSSGGAKADTFFRELSIEIVPLDAIHMHTALGAWQQYGKGRHPAGLNLGDCCAYATAVLKNQPLLYKGNDFARTGIMRA